MIGTLAVLVLILSTPAAAQNVTTVSGTVKDTNGVPYSNGTVQAQLLPAGVTPTIPPPCNGQNSTPCVVSAFSRGSTDSGGNFNMNLASNAVLSPGGTQWQFAVNTTGAPLPIGTGPQTCSATLTISGASQSVSASFSACPALSNVTSGSPAFGSLTSGTNTGQTLTVGSGTTLGISGTGIVQTNDMLSTTVSSLPTAGLATGQTYLVTDSNGAGSCTAGGGSSLTLCRSNGSAWIPITASVSSVASAPGFAVDPSTPTFGAKFDLRESNDGATTNGQNTLTSATLNCVVGDNGKLGIVVNPASGAYLFGTGLVTQTGCNSSTQATLSTTANATVSGLNWGIGTDDTTALGNAAAAAWSTGKGLFLPCGATILTGIPFVWTTPEPFWEGFSLYGCAGNNTTLFVLHPNVTTLCGGATACFWSIPATVAGISANGINGQSHVNQIRLTSLAGLLPTVASTSYGIFTSSTQILQNVQIQLLNFTISGGATCTYAVAGGGEATYFRLNFQNNLLGLACTYVAMQGQGSQSIHDSIFAFGNTQAVLCSVNPPDVCDLTNDYVSAMGGSGVPAVRNTGTGSTNVHGGTYRGGTTNGVFGGTAGRINLFGTELLANGNNVPAIVTTSMTVNSLDVHYGAIGAPPGITISGTGTFNDINGNLFDANATGTMAATVKLIADGHSVKGACTGVATAATTLGLYGTGPNVTATTCTSAVIGSGIVVSGSRTLQNLIVTATAAGVNASSGVVIVLKNGAGTTLTCTIGTATSCVDSIHQVSVVDGDLISIQFTTQAAETLAGVKAIAAWD
jgi:hypothetical protein